MWCFSIFTLRSSRSSLANGAVGNIYSDPDVCVQSCFPCYRVLRCAIAPHLYFLQAMSIFGCTLRALHKLSNCTFPLPACARRYQWVAQWFHCLRVVRLRELDVEGQFYSPHLRKTPTPLTSVIAPSHFLAKSLQLDHWLARVCFCQKNWLLLSTFVSLAFSAWW